MDSMDELAAQFLAEQSQGEGNVAVSPEAPKPSGETTPKEDAPKESGTESRASKTVRAAGTVVKETGRAVIGGVVKGSAATGDLIIEGLDFVEKVTGFQAAMSALGIHDEGFIDDDRDRNALENMADSALESTIGRPETTVGKVGESMASLIGLGGAASKGITKGSSLVSKLLNPNTVQNIAKYKKTLSAAQMMGSGAIADNIIYKETDLAASNLIEDLMPGLKDSYLTMAAIDEGDSNFVKRLKITAEGAGLGLATDLLIGGLRSIKKANDFLSEVGTAKTKVKVGAEEFTVDFSNGSKSLKKKVQKDLVDVKNGLTKEEAALLTADDIAKIAETNDVARSMLQNSETAHAKAFLKEAKDIISKKIDLQKDSFVNFKKYQEFQSLTPKEKIDYIQNGQLSKVKAAGKVDTDFKQLKEYVSDKELDELRALHRGDVGSLEEVAKEGQILVALEENLSLAADDFIKSKGLVDKESVNYLNFQMALEARDMQYNKLFNKEMADAGKKLRYGRDIYADMNAVQFAKMSSYYSKKLTPELMEKMDMLAEVVSKIGKGDTKSLTSMGNLGKVGALLEESFISNYLSSPWTHLLNVTSNSATIVMDNLARVTSYAFKNPQEKLAAKAYMSAYMKRENWSRAYLSMQRFFKTGADNPMMVSGGVKIDRGDSVFFDFAKSFENNNRPLMAGYMNLAGNFSKGIYRSLGASDAFTRSMIVDANMAEDYVMKAFDSSVDPKTIAKGMKNYTQASWEKMDPAVLKSSLEKSLEESDRLLLTKDLEGKMGAFQKGLDNVPMGKVLVPFLKVGANQAALVIQTTPVIRRLSPRMTQMLEEGGKSATHAKAKIYAAGSLIIGSAALEQMGYATGPLSRDQRVAAVQRRAGVKEYSIGGMDMRMLGPVGIQAKVGMILSRLVSSAADSINGEAPEDLSMMSELVAASTMIMTEMAVPSQFVQLSDLFEAVRDASEGGNQRALKEFAIRFAGNAVPLKGQADWVTKLYNYAAMGNKKYDNREMESRVKEVVVKALPGLGGVLGLNPKVDMFGEDDIGSRGFFSDVRNADIFIEFDKLGIQHLSNPKKDEFDQNIMFSPPPRSISFDGVKYDLNHDEYYAYQKYLAGVDETGKPLVGDTMAEAIRKEINEGYPKAYGFSRNTEPSIAAKRNAIRDIRDQYAEIGRSFFRTKLVSSEGFTEKLKAKVEKQENRLKPKLKTGR